MLLPAYLAGVRWSRHGHHLLRMRHRHRSRSSSRGAHERQFPSWGTTGWTGKWWQLWSSSTVCVEFHVVPYSSSIPATTAAVVFNGQFPSTVVKSNRGVFVMSELGLFCCLPPSTSRFRWWVLQSRDQASVVL